MRAMTRAAHLTRPYPQFLSFAFTVNGVATDTLHTLAIITEARLIGFPAWAIIDGWLKTIRDNRR